MKKLIQFSLFFFFSISFLAEIQAECATVHFYRKNGLQSERTLYLFNGSEQIATVNLGDRYKATICSEGNYSFVVKLNPSDMSIYKKTINVQQGQDYFVKLNCLIGADLPTIAKMDTGKGSKEWSRNSKFIGQIKQLQIGGSGNNGGYVNNSSVSSGSNGTQSNGTFQRTQIVNNFKFEIVDMSKAGDMIQFNYKITNLDSEDRTLRTSGPNFYFYDDLGNLLSINELCLVNNCGNNWNTIREVSKYNKEGKIYNIAGTRRALMPSNIPMNAHFIVRGVKTKATKFIRGKAHFRVYLDKDYTDFYLEYNNIPFPSGVDLNNPNKKIAGSLSIELLNAKREGNKTYIKYQLTNNGQDAYQFKVGSGSIYDEQGNNYDISEVSYVTKYDATGSYKYREKLVNTGSSIEMYLILNDVNSKSKLFRRIDVNFENFSLSWDNISLEGDNVTNTIGNSNQQSSGINSTRNGVSTSSSRYINFNELESNLSNYESTVGSKVILDNIYFSSGKDELLQESTPQLQELLRMLKGNNFVRLSILGHTDDIGDATSNMLLSQKRADTIRYYLIQEGIDPARMTSLGKGENAPLATNNTVDGRQMNRRVEIELTK